MLDLYAAVGAALSARWARVAIGVEAATILSWFVLRTIDADPAAMRLWVVLVAGLALAVPTSGLVVVAAIAPFNEGLLLTRDVGIKPALVALLLVSVALRAAPSWRAWRRVPVPVVLAAALILGTGAGLAITRDRFGHAFFASAAQIWFVGIATALATFVLAAWVARRGELRPLAVAVGAAVAATLVGLADWAATEAFRSSALGWLAGAPPFPGRLTGVMRSPTAVATLVLLPVCVTVAAAALHTRPAVRLTAVALGVPLLVAGYLTYSRAVFLALFALAVILAWRFRPRLALAVLAAGLVAGALLLPSYMSLRSEAVGATPEPGQVLLANDRQRLTAWATSVRLFIDRPVLGQGYRAYREVAPAFGDTTLNAPHNEWLRLLAEHGIVVGALGLAWVAATVRQLARVPGWLGAAILGSWVAFVLCACFNNPFLFNQVTIVASVIAGTGIGVASGLVAQRDPAA